MKTYLVTGVVIGETKTIKIKANDIFEAWNIGTGHLHNLCVIKCILAD